MPRQALCVLAGLEAIRSGPTAACPEVLRFSACPSKLPSPLLQQAALPPRLRAQAVSLVSSFAPRYLLTKSVRRIQQYVIETPEDRVLFRKRLSHPLGVAIRKIEVRAIK